MPERTNEWSVGAAGGGKRELASMDRMWRRVLRPSEPEIVEDLRNLRALWFKRRPGRGQLPVYGAISLQELLELGFVGTRHVIDADRAEPMDYLIVQWSRIAAVNADFSGMRISQLESREYWEVVARDYGAVVRKRVPVVHRIFGRVMSRDRVYQRLIMPFERRDGEGCRLLVVFRYVDPPPVPN